jgi:integrase
MLTDIQCKNAKPQSKAYKMADGNGLYLYITKAGNKSWRYNFRINGQQKTYTYGLYPEFSLQEAREEHAKVRKMVSQGIDPHEHEEKQRREKEHAKALTFETMAKEWQEKRRKEVKPKTISDIEKRLNRDVLPSLGNIPMSELSSLDVLNMVKTVEGRGAYEMANRAKQYCSQILRYAVACGKADRDYTLDIQDALATRKVKHQPALEPNELPEFLEALERNEARLFPQTRLALKMLLLTFVRPIELASAEWSEFDLEDKRWIVPAEKTKMRKDHTVPLSQQTIEILEQLREMNGHTNYLFINQRDPRKHMSRDALSKAVRQLGFQDRHSAHGFRALALTALQEKLGYPFHVADCQLGHGKKNSLGAAYDRTQFLEQRIPMMQDWADYIDHIFQAKNSKIAKIAS